MFAVLFLLILNIAASEYQISDTVWNKDTSHKGKRPECIKIVTPPSVQNYRWGSLQNCKNACINEPTGKCNSTIT